MLTFLVLTAFIFLAASFLVIREARRKYLGIWLGAYFAQRWSRAFAFSDSKQEGHIHILFCMVDHFEPISAGSSKEQERERMRDWLDHYPALAQRHRDSYGRP